MGKVNKVRPATASDVFAQSQGSLNDGAESCHWCGAGCDRTWLHDDPPPVPFVKNKNRAKHPGHPYICHGCWLWRRGRVQVTFIDGSYKDGQSAVNHSWWITNETSLAVRPDSRAILYPLLRHPPNRFVLTLLDGSGPNMLHIAEVNDIAEIRGETELRFTLNNIPMSYTVYELETALRDSNASRTPGISALINFCGPCPMEPEPKRGRGRPTEDKKYEPINTLKKPIQMSGK